MGARNLRLDTGSATGQQNAWMAAPSDSQVAAPQFLEDVDEHRIWQVLNRGEAGPCGHAGCGRRLRVATAAAVAVSLRGCAGGGRGTQGTL